MPQKSIGAKRRLFNTSRRFSAEHGQYIITVFNFFHFVAYTNVDKLIVKSKKEEKFDRFNRTILPNDWRQEAKKRPRNEKNIWRFYICQLFFRTIFDAGFIYLQYRIYPYKFIIPEKYICEADPCPHRVDCFVSRPTEKTVFFIYFYIVAILCMIINILEVFYIGFDTIM